MKLYWKNRELDEVDVLDDSVLKAHITMDKEVAVIVDRDNIFSFSELAEDIEEIDGTKDFFTIKFSPERVICGMDFLFMLSKEKEEAIEAIGVFKDTFLSTVIELAKAKGDMVRAEVIRLVWSKFNRNGSIQPIECNQDEVQQFVHRYETEIGLQEQRGAIRPIWRELISLILKYAIYLVTWEKCVGGTSFAEEKGEYKKVDKYFRDAKKAEFIRRYKKCYDMVDITDKALERYAKRSEAKMYRCLELTWDVRVEEYRKFFYASHMFKQESQKGNNSISTTLLGYYFIWEVDEFSHYDRKRARTELFNRGVEKPQLVDCNNKVCQYLSASIEIVMMNIAQINMAKDFISDESVEREEYIKELDSLQIRIMPFVYVNCSKENDERLNNDLIEQLMTEAKEKQNELRKELCKTDGYKILGGRGMFTGIGRTGMKKIADDIGKSELNKEITNLAKNRARQYWQKRNKNLSDACYNMNDGYFDLTSLSNKERNVAVYFDQYVDEQKRCISQEITAILEDAKAKVEK